MKKKKWTERQLKEATVKSTSIGQILARLGLRQAGGNYAQIKKYLKIYNISTAHLKGRAWNKGLKGFYRPFIPLEKILVKNSTYQSFKLKKRLFITGLKAQRCEDCGWAKKTKDGYLPLELDHINGDHHDNRLLNLRILCPNCHSLTPTHRGRKRKL